MKHGILIDGKYAITYDQKHIILPTNTNNDKCQYILSQDIVNNNFSIVLTTSNNQLYSIQLIDKTDGPIEFNTNGLAFVDGKEIDLPYHRKSIHAWRTYNTVTLLTVYGVDIICSLDIHICHINVNGYYHNQLRGLFGNGNYELYDEFILPNNKLSTTNEQFYNSYQLSKTCKISKQTDTNVEEHGKSDKCRKLFDWDSSLRTCYLFVNPSNYRDICEHAVIDNNNNDNNDDILCNIARAYATTCYLEKIPIKIPDNCAKCINEHKINEQYKSISPQKQADIVFVIDLNLTGQSNAIYNDMIQQLIADIKRELKPRDINDIHLSIIGYNDKLKHYHHLTTKGQLDFNGKLNSFKFEDAMKAEKPKHTGNEHIDKLLLNSWEMLRNIERDLGIAADGRAFREAMSYPFRSTASNVIIAIRPDHLEYSGNPVSKIEKKRKESDRYLYKIFIHF